MITRYLLFFLVALLVGCQTTAIRPDLPLAARINAELAIQYLQAGDAVRAKAKVLQAEQQAPALAFVYEAKAYLFEMTGDILAAEQSYQQALRLLSKTGSSHNSYGQFLCRQGQYHLAEQQFLFALQHPDYLEMAEAYENAGLCALEKGDEVVAQHYFSKAMQYDSSRNYE